MNKMKNTILLAVVVVFLATAVGVGSSYYEFTRGPVYAFSKPLRSGEVRDSTEVGEAKLEVVGPGKFNFGTMSMQETRSHTFTVRNIGTAPLTLRFLEKSCQCTNVEMTRHVMEPNEDSEITLSWKPKKYGVLYQVARFETNDYSLQELDLTVTGDVKQTMAAVPTSLEFEGVRAGKAVSTQVMFYGYRADNLAIEDIEFLKEGSAEFFEAIVEPLTPEQIAAEPGARSGAAIQITLKPGAPIGNFTQRIRISTNQANSEPIEIPVIGSVVGNISVVGQGVDPDTGVIEIGVIRGNQPVQRRLLVLLRGEDAADTNLKVVSCDPTEVLEATLEEPRGSGPLKTYPLTVRIKPNGELVDRTGTKVGPFGKIVIESDASDSPRLNQHVSFRLEGSQ